MRICLVTARRDSLRLPRKNHLKVGGVALWERAARFGRMTGWKVVIDSDDPDLLEAAWLGGYSVHPRQTPTEAEGGSHMEAILAAAEDSEATEVLLLQPTSPFRCLSRLAGLVAGFDGEAVHLTSPWRVGASTGLSGWDGNLLLFKVGVDYRTAPAVGIPNPSPYSLQIDTPEDYDQACWLAEDDPKLASCW